MTTIDTQNIDKPVASPSDAGQRLATIASELFAGFGERDPEVERCLAASRKEREEARQHLREFRRLAGLRPA